MKQASFFKKKKSSFFFFKSIAGVSFSLTNLLGALLSLVPVSILSSESESNLYCQ